MQFTKEQIFADACFWGSLKGTKNIDSFACWLLTLFGAALIFIIVNIPSLDIVKIKVPIILFIIATIICIIQKYLSVEICCGYESNKEVEKKIKEQNQDIADIDFDKFCQEIEKPYWPFIRFILKKFFNKLKQGDLTACSRYFIHCFQIQSSLVLLQSIILITCALLLILKINP